MGTPFSEALFTKIPVIGILRGYSEEITLRLIDVYFDAGFTTIEITMNTPGVGAIIMVARKKYDNKLNIGAGTVCSIVDLETVLSAGAQFIVSPITDLALIKHCKKKQVPIFPGAFSPTEIYQAWTAGARMVKLFPASQFGPQFVKDILAPLDSVAIMPTGGVSLDNIPAYKKAGVSAFGIGSLLFDKECIRKKDWKGLTKHMQKVKSVLAEI